MKNILTKSMYTLAHHQLSAKDKPYVKGGCCEPTYPPPRPPDLDTAGSVGNGAGVVVGAEGTK